MVLPILGALAGGGGAIGAALIGADAQQEAADTNWRINLLNYYQRERERKQAIQRADQADREQKLGATDAAGNRTKFVPGVGWVTELADTQQEIQKAQEQEQLQTLNVDLPNARSQRRTNFRKQTIDDADQAEILLDQFRNITRRNPDELRRLLELASTQGINEGFDKTEENVFRGIRRGSLSNNGRDIAASGRARADALQQAKVQARLQSILISDEQYNKDRGATANLYNQFATRAAKLPNVSYQPQNVNGDANNLLNQFARLAQQGTGAAITTRGKEGGTLDYIEPNLGYANAVGAAGASIGGVFNSAGGAAARANGLNTANQYASANGLYPIAQGGIYNQLRQGIQNNQGVF